MAKKKKPPPRKKGSYSIKDEPREGGEDKLEAGRWLYWLIGSYGLESDDVLSNGKARGILAWLKARKPMHEIAAKYGLTNWRRVLPSSAQAWLLEIKGLPPAACKRDASLLLDAASKPLSLYKKLLREIDKCNFARDLDSVACDIRTIGRVLPAEYLEPLIAAGKAKRGEVSGEEIPE